VFNFITVQILLNVRGDINPFAQKCRPWLTHSMWFKMTKWAEVIGYMYSNDGHLSSMSFSECLQHLIVARKGWWHGRFKSVDCMDVDLDVCMGMCVCVCVCVWINFYIFIKLNVVSVIKLAQFFFNISAGNLKAGKCRWTTSSPHIVQSLQWD
jgi:hypothetical protein